MKEQITTEKQSSAEYSDEKDDVLQAVMVKHGVTYDDMRIAKLTRQYAEEQRTIIEEELEQQAVAAHKRSAELNASDWERYHANPHVMYPPKPMPRYISPKDMPGARYANKVDSTIRTRLLAASEDSDSEVDIAILGRVDKMEADVARVRRAIEVIESDGHTIPSKPFFQEEVPVDNVYSGYTPDEKLERKQQGNNTAGRSQALGSMARSSVRLYDIKSGVAMRARLNGLTFDGRGNTGLDAEIRVGGYEPFAPHYQDQAKELMRSLAKKQHEASNEQRRRMNVKVAKEIVGRAGVKIPLRETSPSV